MSRLKARHSLVLSWYYGLPMSWSTIWEFWRAKRAGARSARMIRDMQTVDTVEMPRIVEPEPAGRHALREPSRLLPLAGEGT
jgi:hypothetical protein